MNSAAHHSNGCRCLTKDDLKKLSISKAPLPHNEALRIYTLRQTQLLDSDAVDPSFDRFSTLAQRMFDVPIALISLIDIDRQWFKSNIGLESVAQTPRDHGFCSHTILPESADVFVIEDALLDYRFKTNPLVLGDPHIRFYAGAALTVDEVKVGSLCIIDRVPHIGFSEKERMNMLDLGAAISNLIRERRDSFLRSNKECAKLMNDMIENVRIPLISIASSTESLLVDSDDRKRRLKIEKLNRGRNSTADVDMELDDKSTQKMSDLQVAVGQLKVIVESSICLGDFVVEKAESEEKLWASFTSSNIFQIIEECRQTLRHLEPLANISWDIDMSQLSKGTRHVCSPKAISFVLLNSVQQLSSWWETIKVRVSFRDTGDAEYDCIVQQLDEAPICDIESTWQQGLLVMEFSLSNKRENLYHVESDAGTNMKPTGLLSFYSLQQVLKDVEGEFSNLDEGSSYEQAMSVTIPCAIIISEKDKEVGLSVASSPVGSRVDSEQKALFNNAVEKPLSKTTPRKAPVDDAFLNNRTDSCQLSPTHLDLDLSTDELDMQLRVTEARKKEATAASPAPSLTMSQAMLNSVNKAERGYGGNSMLATLRVLLVEDTASQRKLMGKWLNGQGCEVTFAINGKIGLELLKTRQFDICLMDFLMPVMCGAEAIKKLNEWRHRPAQAGDNRTLNSDLWVNKEMMLVGLSAGAADDELEIAFENGMHFFCPKPVETTMLASILMMRRKASSLQIALSDIGKQAVSMNSSRIIASNPLSQNKAQIKSQGSNPPCWNTEEEKQTCTGESADVVVCRGNTGWRLFKQISRLLSGDKQTSDQAKQDDDGRKTFT